jgi:hypothetical protein
VPVRTYGRVGIQAGGHSVTGISVRVVSVNENEFGFVLHNLETGEDFPIQ